MLNEFMDYLILKRGFEPITIGGYRRVLSKFLRELDTEKPNQEQAEDYLLQMRKKNQSYSHTKNTITAVKRYMEFIGRRIEVELPRRPSSLPAKEILTEGEIARILAETKNSRERAMISILAYCGLRNKELCSLKVKDTDIEDSLIKVIGGKFKKDRIVPMSKECFRAILSYLEENKKEKDEHLFTTLRENNQYSGWSLRKLVKVVAKRAKIKKRVYPHLYRHSFITHLLERGANIVAVQNLAGHSNIQTTMLYSHFSPKKIFQEYQYFIPSYN